MKKIRKRTYVGLALLLFCLYFIPKFCRAQTDGFALLRVTPLSSTQQRNNDISDSFPWEHPALNQPFFYLDSGGQSFVFLSEDGGYVLKLIKDHFRVSFPFHLFLSTKTREKRKQKQLRDFASYHLGFTKLREEAGLIGIHLSFGENASKQVTLYDRLHIRHQVDLNRYAFILQKRAELVYPYLSTLMEKGDEQKAKEALTSLIHLLTIECEKGIFDEDARVHRNLGFVNGNAILIDIGRLRPDPSLSQKDLQLASLKATCLPLRMWLQTTYPHLLPYLISLFKDEELCTGS